MKKFFLFVLIAATATAFSSCNKKGAGVTPTEDSLSLVVGEGTGTQIAAQFGQSGMAFDDDAYLAGFKAALMLDTTKKETSYRAGLNDGAGFAQQIQQLEDQMGVQINKRALYKALAAAVSKNIKKDEPDMEQMQRLGMQMQSLMQKAQLDVAKKIDKEGREYVAKAMKEDKSLKKTASGLVYKLEKPGNGKHFKDGDKVQVRYKGTHIDGKVFDETKEKPTVMTVGDNLIKGWVEVLKLMSPGAKAHVIIPGSLAYGPGGSRGIKPNETLVFDITTGNIETDQKGKTQEKPADARPQKTPAASK